MIGEDSKLFPTPKTQELTLLSRRIQEGSNAYLNSVVGLNPKLLIQSSDAPTVLQEGFRYNALHVAARSGNVEGARIIISKISSTSYMALLYPKDDDETIRTRTRHCTDLYFNMPDKGSLETPLHFAAKFGHYEMVKLLLSHPLCDTKLKNKENKLAEEIIGARASKPCSNESYTKMKRLFSETKIVPIWRDLVNDSVPIVGRPVNPKTLAKHTPAPFYAHFGDILMDFYENEEQSWGPNEGLGTLREIRAYAGPMDDETASLFYTLLKGTTLPCSFNSFSPTTSSTNGDSDSPYRSFIQTDLFQPLSPLTPLTPKRNYLRKSFHGTTTKLLAETNGNNGGLDRVSEESSESGSRWALRSPDEFNYTPKTLSQLLSSPVRRPPLSPPSSSINEDRSIRLRDPEKGIERVGRKYAAQLGIPWTEYWLFLGKFVDLSSETGLVELEDYLYKARERSEEVEMRRREETGMSPLSVISEELAKLKIGEGGVRRTLYKTDDWRSHRIQTPPLKSSPITQRLKMSIPSLCNSKRGERVVRDANKNESRSLIFSKFEDSFEESSVNSSNVASFEHENSWDETESEEEEEEEFYSPVNSSSEEEIYEEFDEDTSRFINGVKPSKEDFQVLYAVSLKINELDPDKFPYIIGWYNSLKALNNSKHHFV